MLHQEQHVPKAEARVEQRGGAARYFVERFFGTDTTTV
jgi:hypothetical protein